MINELRHIRAFLKIAETRNFTRAANDLHLSQSALTVQIQQLEESLGLRLFDRNKRGATLTAAGKDVFGPLQRLLNDAQAILVHAQEVSSASSGFVTIAALPTVAAGVLPSLLHSFLRIYPGVNVQILDVVAERVREAVLRRQVDFGIGTQNGQHAELRAVPLFRDSLVVYVPAGHLLANRSTITLREATAFDLILPSRDSSVRENVEAIAHRERLVLQTRYETNFMPTALGFVKAGLGIAILPESAAGAEAQGFARIPIDDRFSSRQIELLQRRDVTLSPAAESFMHHLQSQLRPAKAARRPITGKITMQKAGDRKIRLKPSNQ